ncbi:mitochondrial splicing system protein [Coemansia sp. RSA 1939]|nr:mitochondrial splicing system protein [Coemansia sp. RSA 1939]KAJ2609437.1 mitochondrial splicing system protein [Coemansia sp. RSA 1804]KAJ2690005.1 mitochondrial splicing system protein [Coemansia sp. RSA 1285]
MYAALSRRCLLTSFAAVQTAWPKQLQQPTSVLLHKCRYHVDAASRAAAASNGIGSNRLCSRYYSLSSSSTQDTRSTIYALSSHPGKSAVAVIRVSGPQTKQVLRTMVPQLAESEPDPKTPFPLRARHALLTRLVHPNDQHDVLDTCLCLWFPGPRSFTGEDMAEFHVHGGTAVVSSVLQALGAVDGVRMAGRGEFSRRSFDNDKMDLTTLEGVADLINAETEAQRRLAVRQSRGELHQLYETWRTTLVELIAHTEAFIDFSEEEDIEDGVYPMVCKRADQLIADIARHLDDKRRGEIMRTGVSLSIVGPPNSGKSTLLNKLAQRQVAIVSPIAGTTRDVVETTLDVGGYPVVVRDTAGLRKSSSDVIEVEGIRRAMESAREADMRIFMLDIRSLAESDGTGLVDDDGADWRGILELSHTFVVFNKTDQISPGTLFGQCSREKQIELAREWMLSRGVRLPSTTSSNSNIVFLSCKTNGGWEHLMRELAEHIRRSWESSSNVTDRTQMPLTKARHREHLQKCLGHLVEFQRINQADDAAMVVVLAAEELRRAGDSLGRITGKVGIEDVLDALFGQFCIGK